MKVHLLLFIKYKRNSFKAAPDIFVQVDRFLAGATFCSAGEQRC
jgi:hypothetical protein